MRMMKKDILYFDMDNVLVDFKSGLDQYLRKRKPSILMMAKESRITTTFQKYFRR